MATLEVYHIDTPGPVEDYIYVDDTSCCLASSDPLDPHIQNAADYSEVWASSSDMRINAVKTKEMVFSFCRSLNLAPITIGNNVIEWVARFRLLESHAVLGSVLECAYWLCLVQVQPAPVLIVTPKEPTTSCCRLLVTPEEIWGTCRGPANYIQSHSQVCAQICGTSLAQLTARITVWGAGTGTVAGAADHLWGRLVQGPPGGCRPSHPVWAPSASLWGPLQNVFVSLKPFKLRHCLALYTHFNLWVANRQYRLLLLLLFIMADTEIYPSTQVCLISKGNEYDTNSELSE